MIKNKINFDRAKRGNNKYSVYVNCKEIIKDATFSSALENFKALKKKIENNGTKEEVSMAKIYDRKTKTGRKVFGYKVIRCNKIERIGEYVG